MKEIIPHHFNQKHQENTKRPSLVQGVFTIWKQFPFQTKHRAANPTSAAVAAGPCCEVPRIWGDTATPQTSAGTNTTQECPLLTLSLMKLLHEGIPAQFMRRSSQKVPPAQRWRLHPAHPPLTACLQTGLINLGELGNRSWEREAHFCTELLQNEPSFLHAAVLRCCHQQDLTAPSRSWSHPNTSSAASSCSWLHEQAVFPQKLLSSPRVFLVSLTT